MTDLTGLSILYESLPRPSISLSYGTAGFRTKANHLDFCLATVGLLAVLRSLSHQGATVGVMITASHNPSADNGVKLVEPMGDMLAQSWESYAIALANAPSPEALAKELQKIMDAERLDLGVGNARVIVARDTRPSGEALVKALKLGIQVLGGELVDHGIKTTPQLHYLVRCINTQGAYGAPTEDGYHQKLAKAFKKIDGKPILSPLVVDAANGVGAVAMEKLLAHLGSQVISIKTVNTDIQSAEKLNHECGADYVKINQRKPLGLDITPGQRCASLDGDADRIVFYYQNNQGTFKLLDGDKIATLAAGFIMKLVQEAHVAFEDGSPIRVGLVQTAYANGSSTSYVKEELKTPVVFTPTGVKHLHHAAEEFDVGVYFEANGHGTVLFSPRAITLFQTFKGTTDKERRALEVLVSLTDLINQTVGDALSDLLMVEAICTYDGLSFEDWDKAYTDLPSKQEKVKVADRTIFVPINADTELSHPPGLQPKINAIVSRFPKGRSFVRPSGTEDVVRVYSEAASREDMEKLSSLICGIVFDHYGGVGAKPAHFATSESMGDVAHGKAEIK